MKNIETIILLLLSFAKQSIIFGASKSMQNVSDHKIIKIEELKSANDLRVTTEHEANLLLGKAIADFNVESIKLALEMGADLNTKFQKLQHTTFYWLSALSWAIENLPSFVSKGTDSSFLNEVDSNKFSDTLDFLISNSMINEPFKEFSFSVRSKFCTPLMYAIQKRYWSVAKFLISNGADVDFVTESGDSAFTCLIDCLFVGEWDTWFCNYLIEKCNDLNKIINQKDSERISFCGIETDIAPLFYVTRKYSQEIRYTLDTRKMRIFNLAKKLIGMLIKNGVDIYFRDSQGNLLIDDSKICDAELKDYIIKTYELHKNEIEALKKTKEKRILESIPKILPETLDKLIISYLGFNNCKDGSEATQQLNQMRL